jgi:hypothetical protein
MQKAKPPACRLTTPVAHLPSSEKPCPGPLTIHSRKLLELVLVCLMKSIEVWTKRRANHPLTIVDTVFKMARQLLIQPPTRKLMNGKMGIICPRTPRPKQKK